MSKQPKTSLPTDADLKGNPMIGGHKGTTASGTRSDDLDASLGAITIEGDSASNANTFGGVDKSDAPGGRASVMSDPPRPPKHD